MPDFEKSPIPTPKIHPNNFNTYFQTALSEFNIVKEIITSIHDYLDIEEIQWFSLDGFGKSIGVEARNGIELILYTSSVINNIVYLIRSNESYWSFIYDGKWCRWRFPFVKLLAITNQEIYICLADGFINTPPTNTSKCLGWKILNATLYILHGNGTTLVATDSGVTFDTSIQNTELLIEYDIPNNTIYYYVAGVLVGTVTTELPPSTVNYYISVLVKTLEANIKHIRLGRFLFEKVK